MLLANLLRIRPSSFTSFGKMVKVGGMEFTSLTEAGVSNPSPVELHLLPLLQPEKQVKPPALERLPKGSLQADRIAFKVGSTSWISNNHVFPAAFPRSHFHATHKPGPAPLKVHAEVIKGGKEVERQFRKEDMQLFEEQISQCPPETIYPPHSQQEAERIAQTLADSGQPQLWGCIQRIVPDSTQKKGKPITLFLSHANGFHKEIYEPMLESLLAELESNGSDVFVDEIWSLDTFNSGDAGILNRDTLSVCTPWWDHARDVQQFLQNYLPPKSENVKTQLQKQKEGSGRKDRTIIAITHSHSGAACSMLFTGIADLCDGHISIDPMVSRFDDFTIQPVSTEHPLYKGAIIRKDVFKNRQAVLDYMDTKPYFQAWDARVREKHVRYGFYPLVGYEDKQDSPVTLCMTKWSEASQFAHSWCGAWGALELTRPKNKGFNHIFWTNYARAAPQLGRARDQIAINFAKFGDRFTWSDWELNHLAVQENPDFSGKEVAKVIKQSVAKHINSAKL